MGVRFSADDILAVALAIEVNGAHFYESAAGKLADSRGQGLLRDLARWERAHEETFAALRAALAADEKDSGTLDPSGEAGLYLNALADASVFDPQADALAALGPNPTYRAILLKAMALEKDSIAFYIGMRELVPERLGRSKVDAIIKEEMKHVAILHEELGQT